jgi:DNA-binding response OmpR family regulator
VKESLGAETLSLDSAVKELRAIFIEGTTQRLAAMETTLAQLRTAATPPEAALKALRGQFRSLAGTGETYGFPAVSRVGVVGERQCAEVMDGHVPVAVMLPSWAAALADGRAALVAPTARPPPSAPSLRILACGDPNHGIRPPGASELRDATVTGIESPAALEAALEAGTVAALVLVPGGCFGDVSAVLSRVRAHPHSERAAILVLLDHLSVAERIDLMQLGATRVLPRDCSWQQLARIAALHQGNEASQGRRVLVLEHDRALAAQLRTDLEARGCEVEVYSQLPALLAGWQEHAADLLLLGRDASGVVSWPILETIRKRDRRHFLPVLVLLAEATPEQRREAFTRGADDFVVLPYVPDELAARVETRLELRQARRQQSLVAARAVPVASRTEGAKRARPIRLLLADDDRLVARLLEPRLRAEGWSVTRVSDGEQAERLIAAGGFDLLLLDLHMPFRSGFDLLQWMSQRGFKDRTKVVILSAVNREEVILQAFALKADDFIAKPFNPEIVVTRLRRLLGA